MKNVIEQMLAKYELNSDYDRVNALKEIIQDITLSGLSRGGFFKKAAFYKRTFKNGYVEYRVFKQITEGLTDLK